MATAEYYVATNSHFSDVNVKIESGWNEALKKEFGKPYFQDLIAFVKEEFHDHTCYPPGNQIFSAFDHCPLDQLKVVILGQDPYHGPGQANGLCFSVADGISLPPSLRNIFKEINSQLDISPPSSGNLERWAQQGVLLLNATLTVRAKTPGSHQNQGWEQFTDAVIQAISNNREDVVFMLWGAYAQKKGAIIDPKRHHVLQSSHPSPFAAHKGFFGNGHFVRTNEYLVQKGLKKIDW
jgi:uracil-DNA glycosylase